MEQQPKFTALYCRLSKDDERHGKSLSIETQKTLLLQYAKENNLFPVEFYIDDGYTGLNFDRPDFQRMIEDVALGKIHTVVTKDLSRLGRDHIQTGQYSEIYFPTHKVRYIAVNDGYDSENQQTTYYASLKTAINEFYSRDTSVKIKASFKARAKEGKHHSVVPPFGYLKDPADHNTLIPDPETASVIVKIYDLVLKGWGNHRIRDYLRETKVPCPSWFHHSRGWLNKAHMFPTEESRYLWRPDTLRLIIRNPVYCGDLAYGKSETIFKTKKHPKIDESKWIVVQDTHEALVSREVWERANQLIAVKRQDYKDSIKNPTNLFSGLLKCADCGKAMSRRKYGSNNGRIIYVCSHYATYGVHKCSQHKVFEEDLLSAVTEDIRSLASLVLRNKEALIAQIIASQPKKGDDYSLEQLKSLKRRLADVTRMLDRVYEDHVLGTVTDGNYNRLMAKYQKEQELLEKQIKPLEQAQKEAVSRISDAERIAALLEQYADFDTLSPAMLNALIDRIEVSEPEVVDGKYEQQITIHYRFVGVIQPIVHDATRFYKSAKCTQASQQRAARQQKERIAAVAQEVEDDMVLSEKTA